MRAGRRLELRRWGIIVLLAVVLPLLASSPAAAKRASTSQPDKYASLVIDADNGRVLHSEDADTLKYPASLTKMMTLYMLFQALDAGEVTLDTRIEISRRAARQPATRIGLGVGQTLSAREAILSLVTKSANDVAMAVAEHLADSEEDFAIDMTTTARKLGMSRTTFRNASGLPNPEQMTTARDMATLALALQRHFPQYYPFFSTEHFSFKGLRHDNHNRLLMTYEGADGIKTGFIGASGFNLVASARRDGRRLIGVVFGGETARGRDRHMEELLDAGFGRIDPGMAADARPQFPDPPKAAAASRKAAAKFKGTSRAEVASKSASGKPAPESRARASEGEDEWAIQVGAFAEYKLAMATARRALANASGFLEDGFIKVVPLERKGKRPVFRARIVGLSKKQALGACASLGKQRLTCMEMRSKDDVELASSSR